MGETLKEELMESLSFWEDHLKDIDGLFNELFPPEERKKTLGE